MAVILDKNIYTAFRFLIEIEGLIVGGFSEVSGIQMETQVEEYLEGGVNNYTHLLPRNTKYSRLVFKRGVTDSDTLWKWYKDVTTGKFKRRSGSIILQDYSGKESVRWNFSDAYPVKWSGPELSAANSSVAVETFELVHNGLLKG